MATLATYVGAMWTRQQAIARKLGCNIGDADKTVRVLNKSLLVLLSVVIKTLTDKGVISDAELLATMDTARDAAYDDEPPIQLDPDPDP